MATYTQAWRFLRIATPLGPDALLLEKLTGREALSDLFEFELDLLAQEPIAFDKLLGQAVTVTLAPHAGPARHIHGIVSELRQGHQVAAPSGKNAFIRYRARLVPRLWLLSRRVQSRIWQHQSVPDILHKLLHDEWKLDVAFSFAEEFHPRDHCFQYRESDLAFACRLMEDEGIHFYFKHRPDGCQLVVSNEIVFSAYPELAAPGTLVFDPRPEGNRDEPRVSAWSKIQRLRSGKYTLWDHSFELPGQHLEAAESVHDGVPVGKAKHPLSPPQGDFLEIYDYPGGYAQRFDGIDQGGGEQKSQLAEIFKDNVRTAKIRMREEAAQGLVVEGQSDCWYMLPGHAFGLTRHFDADDRYLLIAVEHQASVEGAFFEDKEATLTYQNRFQCLPKELPFVPLRRTPRPRVDGTQTATVVGPPGEEIFCDKFGRVKVQFHWDRQGQHNADSSCWMRVAQTWAGKGFGAVQVPRAGEEVVVDFLEGDPDRPIIIGRVYNADFMPPYLLPKERDSAGLRSRSVAQGPQYYNELRFVDTPGSEHVHMRAQKDLSTDVGHDETTTVEGNSTETIQGNYTETIGGNSVETVQGNFTETIFGSNTEIVSGVTYEEFHNNVTEIVHGANTEIFLGVNSELIAGLNFTVAVLGTIEVFLPLGFVELILGENLMVSLDETNVYMLGERSYHGSHKEHIVTTDDLADILGEKSVQALTSINLQALEGVTLVSAATNVKGEPRLQLLGGTTVLMGDTVGIGAAASILLQVGAFFIKITPEGITLGCPDNFIQIGLANLTLQAGTFPLIGTAAGWEQHGPWMESPAPQVALAVGGEVVAVDLPVPGVVPGVKPEVPPDEEAVAEDEGEADDASHVADDGSDAGDDEADDASHVADDGSDAGDDEADDANHEADDGSDEDGGGEEEEYPDDFEPEEDEEEPEEDEIPEEIEGEGDGTDDADAGGGPPSSGAPPSSGS